MKRHLYWIPDYAAIGCTRSVALVERGGSIDWLCWPRFDSPSIFGRLLDVDKGGFFAIHPAVDHQAKRRYLDGTNVIDLYPRVPVGAPIYIA